MAGRTARQVVPQINFFSSAVADLPAVVDEHSARQKRYPKTTLPMLPRKVLLQLVQKVLVAIFEGVYGEYFAYSLIINIFFRR